MIITLIIKFKKSNFEAKNVIVKEHFIIFSLIVILEEIK